MPLISFIVFEPHKQFSGKLYLLLLLSLFNLFTETTCGITSPALWITIVSPILISFLLISSSLCSVALETTTPPTVTGSTLATGVIAPVLPIWYVTDLSLVIICSVLNLYAIAHLGDFDVKPNSFWIFIALS